MSSRFQEKLDSAAKRNRSLLCVGLDPDPDQMPVTDVFEFNRAIIDATSDLVCAYKPNLAFYEALGEPGREALERTLGYVPDEIPVIGDSKRGDVQSSSRFHAKALFDVWGFDAATINPYGGHDAVQPFLDYPDKGIFVWCRSSNRGAREIQDLQVAPAGEVEARPLYEWIAKLAGDWNVKNNVGLVVGAPYPEELKRVRNLCPNMPILVPGIGVQEGPLADAVANGIDSSGRNAIINVSRSVIYASKSEKFAREARRKAEAIRNIINGHLELLGLGWGESSMTESARELGVQTS